MKKTKVEKAIEVLKTGGVIVYPTETVYGLGADIFNKKAVQKIYELKGRKKTKSLSIALSNKNQIKKYAVLSKTAKKYLKFLPGPITLVLPKKKIVPNWITKNKFVGIRVPDNKTALKIIKKFGKPITSTSANISGQKDPISARELPRAIRKKVDLIIDEGKTKYKRASTVLNIWKNKVVVLR